MMYNSTGRYSPASVAVDFADRSSGYRSNSDCGRSIARSTDSSDSLQSYGSPEHRLHPLPVTSTKCRLLPCRTFVSTGSCCYGDRCVFLHDQSVVSKPVFVKYLVSFFP
jgi:hypothetical protein